jgi:hypothetical protein
VLGVRRLGVGSAGRADGDVGPGGGEGELLGDHAGGVGLARAGQAFVVAVQAPDVARVLAGPAEGGVESEVCGVDGLGEGDLALLGDPRMGPGERSPGQRAWPHPEVDPRGLPGRALTHRPELVAAAGDQALVPADATTRPHTTGL